MGESNLAVVDCLYCSLQHLVQLLPGQIRHCFQAHSIQVSQFVDVEGVEGYCEVGRHNLSHDVPAVWWLSIRLHYARVLYVVSVSSF